MARTKKAWIDLGSDCNWQDHGGVWGRPSGDDRVWQVIQFENCESWGDGATGYYVSFADVDLQSDAKGAALSYIGSTPDGCPDRDFKAHPVSDAELAYALHSYGIKEIDFELQGTSPHALMRAAKRAAKWSY